MNNDIASRFRAIMLAATLNEGEMAALFDFFAELRPGAQEEMVQTIEEAPALAKFFADNILAKEAVIESKDAAAWSDLVDQEDILLAQLELEG